MTALALLRRLADHEPPLLAWKDMPAELAGDVRAVLTATPTTPAPATGALLPCPFCGSTELRAIGRVASVRCLSCEAFGPDPTDDADGTSMWNTRAPSPTPPPPPRRSVSPGPTWRAGRGLRMADGRAGIAGSPLRHPTARTTGRRIWARGCENTATGSRPAKPPATAPGGRRRGSDGRHPAREESGMRRSVWILTRSFAEYDQHGDYFVAVFFALPSERDLVRAGVSECDAAHVHSGGGRRDCDHNWYELSEHKESA